MDSAGRFIAYELRTVDPPRTSAFYREVFGWATDGTLGVTSLGPHWCRIVAAEASGWIGFVTVPDVDEAAEIAAESGGSVVAEPHDDERLGRVAVLRDPAGAAFGVVTPEGSDPDELGAEVPAGAIAWNVLVTPDPERVLPFYMRLFGWTAERHDLDGLGTYLVCERDGALTAGIIAAAADFEPGALWLSAIAVTDVAPATTAAAAAGATVRWDDTFVPEIGRFSVVIDPVGARVAMLQITAKGEDIR